MVDISGEVMNGVLSLFYVAGVAFGALVSTALLTDKHRSQSHKLLACLVLLVSIDLLLAAVHLTSLHPLMVDWLHVPTDSALLYAPLLYLYLRAQLVTTTRTGQMVWHFALFAGFQVLTLLAIASPSSLPWLTIRSFQNSVCVMVIAIYSIACVHIARTALRQKKRCSIFRNCKIALTSLFAAQLGYMAIAISNAGTSESLATLSDSVAYCVLAASLMLMAYGLLRSAVAVTQAEPLSQQLEPSIPQDREKYGNNRLPNFVRDSITSGLTDYMRCAQPWLKYDLTLSHLASCINVNSHQLSQIINSEFGKSFACFINEYRVESACRLLTVSDNKTILNIALESGFASKSSFNALFKKHTGLTPSEYRRKFQVTQINARAPMKQAS